MKASGRKSLLTRVRFAWCATRDTSMFKVVGWLRKHDFANAKWVRLSCDIEPRQLTCDYLRETPSRTIKDGDSIILSTHYLRRIQTNIKLSLIFAWTRIVQQEICVLSTDGLSGARPFWYPYRLFLVSQWFNSPDEADFYWTNRQQLSEKTRRLELFSERPGVCDPSPSKSLSRISRDFVLAAPSYLEHHFPSIRQIVFASDITTDLRSDSNSLLRRLRERAGTAVDLDGALWKEAKKRTDGIIGNTPLTLQHLLLDYGLEPQLCDEVAITEVELDALRLTLHSRERVLYLKAIAQSDLARYLKVVGNSWRAIPEIRPFVIDTPRFPVGQAVSDLQRSRACPDFGSSLGSIPLYFRAQTLAARAIGLIQRSDPRGNPLLDGLPRYRRFNGVNDLLTSCRAMLDNDDASLLREEEIIRNNYLKRQVRDRLELKQLIWKLNKSG